MDSAPPPEPLVIAVTTRALLNLTLEHQIASENVQDFFDYQKENQACLIHPGPAFSLVSALCSLNQLLSRKVVKLVLLTRNHPIPNLRVQLTLKHYGLIPEQSILTGGGPITPYLRSVDPDIFLSADKEDVQEAIDGGHAAALMGGTPRDYQKPQTEITVAFDADCVIFDDESERVFKARGLEGYQQHEEANLEIPLADGPLARLYAKLSELKKLADGLLHIKLAVVTARNGVAGIRALRSLESKGFPVDFAALIGQASKTPILAELGPDIFFDDDEKHCAAAEPISPTGHVLYGPKNIPTPVGDPPTRIAAEVAPAPQRKGPARSQSVELRSLIHTYVGSPKQTAELLKLCESELAGRSDEEIQAFLNELRLSIQLQPTGSDRPARHPMNSKAEKMRAFLKNLLAKHRAKESLTDA